MSQKSNVQQTARMVNMVGQIGCVTGFVAIIIVGAAFGVGRLIDSWLELESGIFTVLLMLGSFPITLYAITRISLVTLMRAQQAAEKETSKEETQNEENSDV